MILNFFYLTKEIKNMQFNKFKLYILLFKNLKFLRIT